MPRPGATPPEFTTAHFPRAAWPADLAPGLVAGRSASQAWATARDKGTWDAIDTPTFTLAVLDKVLEIEDAGRADATAPSPASEAVIQFVYNKAIGALPRSHRYTSAPAFEKVEAFVRAALSNADEAKPARRDASGTSVDARSTSSGSDE
ncbi:hypothetical protein Q8F55_008355 [Vanrija albida]|uniref:Uncharacterized protein n=1 Tax=Vanrija albida TaxID=181172 RepID=A0ABR3PVZ8_9TREE